MTDYTDKNRDVVVVALLYLEYGVFTYTRDNYCCSEDRML